jgi:hypothetical protein
VNQQLYRFRDLSDSLLGIVFLGTPHITAANERASQAFSRILRSDPRSPSKRTVSQKDLSSLAVVGLQFEELNLQIPILSAYETLETKLSAPLWFSKKAVVLYYPVSSEIIWLNPCASACRQRTRQNRLTT